MQVQDEVIATSPRTGHIHAIKARDWIAVNALQGLLANTRICDDASALGDSDTVCDGLAALAYKVADTMLEYSEASPAWRQRL
jgi:hypothetical protein